MAERIEIIIEAHIEMDVDQVWPDGDQPDEITSEAVAEVMRMSRTVERLISEWDLSPMLSASCCVLSTGKYVEAIPARW